MNKNIILCGVGGQGTILASRLIAAAAMAGGLPIKTAETIGMAQRGGSVFSHIRIGEGVSSPLMAKGEADLIIGFEPGEAVRQLPYLKEGGTVVTSTVPVVPVSAMVGQFPYEPADMLDYLRQNVKNLILVDAEKAFRDLNSSRVLNVALLGAALSGGSLGLARADLEEALLKKVPEKYLELNKKALSWFGFGQTKERGTIS